LKASVYFVGPVGPAWLKPSFLMVQISCQLIHHFLCWSSWITTLNLCGFFAARAARKAMNSISHGVLSSALRRRLFHWFKLSRSRGKWWEYSQRKSSNTLKFGARLSFAFPLKFMMIYDDLVISLGSHSWDSNPMKSRICLLLPCSAGSKFGLNHLDMGGPLCANPCAHTSGLAAYIGNACYTVIMVGFIFNPYGVSGRGT